MRPENGVFRADPGLRKFVGAFKIAIFLAATVATHSQALSVVAMACARMLWSDGCQCLSKKMVKARRPTCAQ